MSARTESSGRSSAGLCSRTRAAIRVFGATSTASVLRLFLSASSANSSPISRSLASWPAACGFAYENHCVCAICS